MLLKSTREEIVAWENGGVGKQDQRLSFDIPGLDFSGYNDENSADA
jgi:hypothetical protein